MSTEIPFVPWSEFVNRFDWEPGDHVALTGPTGSGKTTVGLALMSMRRYGVVLATKPEDPTLDRFAVEQQFEIIEEWHGGSPLDSPRRMLWPDARSLNSIDERAETFALALDHIFRQGRWAVYWDDLPYFVESLNTKDVKMQRIIREYLYQGRSIGISVVVSGQRPYGMPRAVWSNSQHFFVWRVTDKQDLRRLGEIGGVDSTEVTRAVSGLHRYEALYINAKGLYMCRTMAGT